MSESKAKTLRHKLFLAGKAAQEVKKNGDGDGFKYARAEDVLAEASRVLEKQGILVIPSVEAVELRFLKNGGAIAKASMSFEVTDTRTGETFTKPWVGTGFDSPGDKAAYAAQTGAKKYFLASLLGIPFGTDPEDAAPKSGRSAEARRIAAEQDRAAEQPDVPKDPDGQEPSQAQAPTDPQPPAESGTAADTAPDPAPAESIDADHPADPAGLS